MYLSCLFGLATSVNVLLVGAKVDNSERKIQEDMKVLKEDVKDLKKDVQNVDQKLQRMEGLATTFVEEIKKCAAKMITDNVTAHYNDRYCYYDRLNI